MHPSTRMLFLCFPARASEEWSIDEVCSNNEETNASKQSWFLGRECGAHGWWRPVTRNVHLKPTRTGLVQLLQSLMQS
jgi:hypothetical protein